MPSRSDVLAELWSTLGGDPSLLGAVAFGPTGDHLLPSVYEVATLADATVAAAGLALAEWAAADGDVAPGSVTVDGQAVAAAFVSELLVETVGWERPAIWDPIAGDYRTADGWIRLHTNYAHHRDAVLSVLGTQADREQVVGAVARLDGVGLEQAVVDAGGCAAVMRTADAWAAHPQGAAVALEPIVAWTRVAVDGPGPVAAGPAAPPLAGVRVLDLTRVIAGPVATRTLSAFGADVVRIDPVGFEEVPALLVETTAGKRCAALDLRTADDRAHFEALVDEADVLVHGYRPGALAGLGLAPEELRARRPGLAVVGLCAYGETGPWAARRGFDSLVQMSSGIAETGGRAARDDGRPGPLPAQALDHGTGYLLAAAAVRALCHRRATGEASEARLSLARTARVLADLGTGTTMPPRPEPDALQRTVAPFRERAATAWGPVERIRTPVAVAGTEPGWTIEPGPLGVAPPAW